MVEEFFHRDGNITCARGIPSVWSKNSSIKMGISNVSETFMEVREFFNKDRDAQHIRHIPLSMFKEFFNKDSDIRCAKHIPWFMVKEFFNKDRDIRCARQIPLFMVKEFFNKDRDIRRGRNTPLLWSKNSSIKTGMSDVPGQRILQ